jgi:Methyltransferase domain
LTPEERKAYFHSLDRLRETARLERTTAAVPHDATTVLEVGFNDLRFTRKLRQEFDLVSIDLPRPVTYNDGCKLAFAEIQSLPFKDKGFETAVCTEVLEHLPDKILHRAALELLRVTRKYLLVSVPYRQRVWNALFKCAHCGYVCNNMEHLRYFDEKALADLFPGTAVVKTELIAWINGSAPDWLYWMASRIGNSWYKFTYDACPNCKRPAEPEESNLLGFVLERIIWRLENRAKQQPAWILMVLRVGV